MKQKVPRLNPRLPVLLGLVLMLLHSPLIGKAEPLKIAVAANFTDAIKALSSEFEKESSYKTLLAFGSTGKHYAQIRHGAPFDLFFAADSRRPRLLEEEGIAIRNTRLTYARGRLVLWSPKANFVDAHGAVLAQGHFRFLSIANPKFAPYGYAAMQIFQKRGLWKQLQGKIVRGENITQTYQFILSGNADLGFIAYSQIVAGGTLSQGSHWLVPEEEHTPIVQQAILLKESPGARLYLQFVASPRGKEIIRRYGYETP